MSSAIDKFAEYAAAEKQLSEQAGPILARIIRDIEERHGVRIQEVRVTVGRDETDGHCVDTICVIVE